MDAESSRNVGRRELVSQSNSVSAPRETDPTPAVTRPGVVLTSTMVTRSRARGGRSMSVDPEVEFRPETGAHRGEDTSVPTSALCRMWLPAARPSLTGVTTTPMTVDRPGNADAIIVKAKPSSPLETPHFLSGLTEPEATISHPCPQTETTSSPTGFPTVQEAAYSHNTLHISTVVAVCAGVLAQVYHANSFAALMIYSGTDLLAAGGSSLPSSLVHES